jgi:hypothetical protein
VDQQDFSSFFTISTLLRPTIKFTMEVGNNDTLPFLDGLVMKRVPNLAMKVHQKPHAGCYLRFKSNHPHHVKRVVHSLISRTKVIHQDQKDFSNKLKNIRHDLMVNEYSQEFADFVMKPLRSNLPSSDTIYQGTVSIPYVKGISKKFRHIGNRFNVRTTFKTVMKTELKKALFWDVAPCRYCVDLRFGGMYRLHLQGRRKKKKTVSEEPARAGAPRMLQSYKTELVRDAHETKQ